MGFSFKETDRGWEKLLGTVKTIKARGAYVEAGVLGKTAARSGDEIDNVTLATIHEFGAGNIPERSFIRQPFDVHREKYIGFFKRLAERAYSGKADIAQGLGLLGLAMVKDMRARILDGAGIPPPNAPSTIAAKGSSRPLVDTGQLLRSITHQVVSGEGGDL